MGVRFLGWGVAVPDRIVTNDELSETLDTTDEWIFERTGIHERRVGGTAKSLGVEAGRRALQDANVDPLSIDFLVLATTTPDRLIPATAPMVANELGLVAPAMDVNAACSGFMYALRTAQGLLATGATRVLVVGSENLSRWTDWNDRTIAYQRCKTGVTSLISFGEEVAAILNQLPASGQLFPALARIHERHR